MSGKNHHKVDGKLLQTDKRFSQLKPAQIERINEWLYLEYSGCCWDTGTPPKSNDDILDTVYSKIEEADIWIPREEVLKYYQSKKSTFQRRYKREARSSVAETM